MYKNKKYVKVHLIYIKLYFINLITNLIKLNFVYKNYIWNQIKLIFLLKVQGTNAYLF